MAEACFDYDSALFMHVPCRTGMVVRAIHIGIPTDLDQDRTIIGTAIPKITDDFKSIGDVGWYASSYLITLCAFQLIYGRIYTFYSPKWVLLYAIVVFEIGVSI
jgi:MFS family permease